MSPVIRTPDQRIRIFVSSTLSELADERSAARRAIDHLRLTPVMFELGARPHPARALYRSYLDQSHVFVGVYWQRYGWVAPDETVSGLEDEYDLSAGMPRLVYLRDPAPEMEPRLRDLIDRIQSDDTVSYKRFASADELERLLTEDLALLLSERFLEPESDELPASTSWGVRLPEPPSAIVGRAAELDQIVAQLTDTDVRILTLLGPGGIGKTRLGLEAARRAAPLFTDGAVMVPLDGARDDSEVLPAVGAAMGLSAERRDAGESVAGAIGTRRVLLFLDNFEHVLGAARPLASLVERCPHLTLLVTSRAPLGLRAEHDILVPPLGLPSPESEDPAATSSVQLFVQRARAVRVDFALTAENREAVYELCRRLEGIPLAIELAAARVRMLSPRDLLDRLDARLDLLVARAPDLPERQRTLRATIEWSHELLTDQERRLLARLAVFDGGWTLESAERVGNGELDVLDALSGLVEHSLVAPTATGTSAPRFRMLDMIRSFARDRLERSGELDELRRRHVAHYAVLARDGRAKLLSSEHRPWLDRLAPEWSNMRSALQFAIATGDMARAVDLLSCGFLLCWIGGRLDELHAPIAAIVEHREQISGTPLGRMLFVAAATKYTTGLHDEAAAFLDEFDRVRDAVDDPSIRGGALLYRAFLDTDRWDAESVRRHLTEAEAILSGAGDSWSLVFCLSTRGTLAMFEGHFDEGLQYHERAFELACRSGNELAAMQSRALQALAGVALGDVERARHWLADTSVYLDEYAYAESSAYAYDAAAGVAQARGDTETAARLLGAAEMVRNVTTVRVWATVQPVHDQIVADVRAAAGSERFTRWQAEGAGYGPPQANALLRRVVV